MQSNGIMIIQGRTSHAFSKIIPQIERVNTGATTGTLRDATIEEYKNETLADDPFSFSMELDQSNLENTPEYVDKFAGFVAEKTDLTTMLVKNKPENKTLSFIQKSINDLMNRLFFVRAATRGQLIKVEPIPSYLEGIAYDSTGKVMGNAIVGVYLKNAKKAYYETLADTSGHFKIGSEFLPPFNYDLRYGKITGEYITVSTSKYLVDNHVYLATNDINTYSHTLTTPELIAQEQAAQSKKIKDESRESSTTGGNVGVQKNTPTSKKTSNGLSDSRETGNMSQILAGGGMSSGVQGIMMIVVVLLVLLMIGVGAFIMMKSKQQTPQY
jgi:hypothetical protein